LPLKNPCYRPWKEGGGTWKTHILTLPNLKIFSHTINKPRKAT